MYRNRIKFVQNKFFVLLIEIWFYLYWTNALKQLNWSIRKKKKKIKQKFIRTVCEVYCWVAWIFLTSFFFKCSPFYWDVFLYKYLPLTSKDIYVYETDSKWLIFRSNKFYIIKCSHANSRNVRVNFNGIFSWKTQNQ